MRKARVIQEQGGIYHITSRIIEKKFLLNDLEKERFRTLMWQLADFSGVTILTHCFMSNHFHLLIEVPEPPASLSEAEIELRLGAFPRSAMAAKPPAAVFRHHLNALRAVNRPENEIVAFCDRQRVRMFDLTTYVKELKQRFTQNYNLRHERKGPLWEERFKSTLLEPTMRTLLEVSAYIDLNPIRANLCQKPEMYRFCGYSGAVAGDQHCLRGYQRLFALMGLQKPFTETQALAAYRVALFGRSQANPRKNRAGIPAKQIRAVLATGGQLGFAEKLTHRIRYISDGLVLGSQCFVETYTRQSQKKNRLKRSLAPIQVSTLGSTDLTILHAIRGT